MSGLYSTHMHTYTTTVKKFFIQFIIFSDSTQIGLYWTIRISVPYIYRINYYVQKREFVCIPSRTFLLTLLTDFFFVIYKLNIHAAFKWWTNRFYFFFLIMWQSYMQITV